MDLSIAAGLAMFGSLINNKDDISNDNIPNYLNTINSTYKDNYDCNIMNNANKILYNKISNLYIDSQKDNNMLVNNIWRIQNDNDTINNNKNTNNLINNDINEIKNINYNNIETMKNINHDLNSNDSDSIFSDNFSLPNHIPDNKKKIPNLNDNITNNCSNNSDISYYDSDNDSNINLKVLNTQNKFLEDIKSNISDQSSDDDTYEKQFDGLKFNHNGIPNTMFNDRQTLNIFNDKIRFSSQSDFNPKDDGRYGVSSDMTHNNMQPFFKSNTYGYNPMFNKEQTNYAVRKVELFTGSDQNPQFKHKSEVKQLFSPVTNKVDSVTGTPVFTDFYESRYIPSDKRQGERPFQPVMVTPGLNLGYNETGNNGLQDLYRVLPKNVDQLRVVNNPKVSYKPPVIPGQKGDRRGAIGQFVQKGPDRFFYNSPDSYLPQVGDFIAPAIYGKHLKTQTNRSLAPDNIHLNPAKSDVDFNTPEYLQGEYKKTFKRTFDYDGPRNILQDYKGQIINQDTYVPHETQRQDTNWGDKWIGIGGNKQQDYLVNHENYVPETTQRQTMPQLPNTNVDGNFKSVPLTNYLNLIPETTLRQIISEDDGRKNLTNISNSIKGYLFNSINAIKDETLRSLLTEKIILTNVKENSERGYLFNNENAVTNPNLRNLSENNLILGVLSNKEQGYLFNNIDSIPDINLRNMINTLYESGGMGFKGNYEEQYTFNYENSVPNINLRNITQDQKYIVGAKGNHQEQYSFNYENSVPDINLRNMTQDQKYIVGAKGNHQEQYSFNYENSTPQTTMREYTGPQQNITGTIGNKLEQYNFNYENGTPDSTMRVFTGPQKNIVGTKGNSTNQIGFNYDDIPNPTLRNLSEVTKNVVGMVGNGTQSRSQLDAYNQYLNNEKEVVAQGRDPVPVKDNRGPVTHFTQYVFCDDNIQPQQVYSNTRPLTNIPNDLYSFSGN
jgi:hypothetical protein